MSTRSLETDRVTSLLRHRRFSAPATVAVLSVALLFGVGGFAIHTFWSIAVFVLVLGIGYVAANAYLDRSEAMEAPDFHALVDHVTPVGDRVPTGAVYPEFDVCRRPTSAAS